MATRGVTITVDGVRVFVAVDTNIDDLTDAEYAALDDHCSNERHAIGRCPLCADLAVTTTGSLARDGGDLVDGLWSGWHKSRTTNPDERATFDRLVEAHKVVKSFVDTFAISGEYNVTFDPKITTAATDMKSKQIVISPAPALDPTLDAAKAGIIMTGMALHESSHVRYGRNTFGILQRTFDPGNPDRDLAFKLSNLLDDVRIERRFAVEYPGFAHVFPPTLAYVAEASIAKSGPWTPTVESPFDLAVAAIRYPAFATWSSETEAERDWWQTWSERSTVSDSPTKHVVAIREAIDHARSARERVVSPPAQTPTGGSGQGDAPAPGSAEPTESAGDAGSPGTQAPTSSDSDSAGDSAGDSADDSADDAPMDDSARIGSCVGQEIADAAQANGASIGSATNRLAQQAVNLADTLVEGPLGKGEIRNAATLFGRRRSVAMDPLISRVVRDAMVRSRGGHTSFDSGQLRGRLDNGSLTRLAYNDPRLFRRRNAPSPRKFHVWLLVDCSGSMQGSPLDSVIAISKSIADATRYAPNIRMRIYGWTDSSQMAAFGAYRAWETGQPVDEVSTLGKIAMGGTPDAAMLAWAGSAIVRETERDEAPVLIVLTDGQGDIRMKDQVDLARKRGVDVIGVAVGGYATRIAETYGSRKAVPWQGSIRLAARPIAEAIARMAGTR